MTTANYLNKFVFFSFIIFASCTLSGCSSSLDGKTYRVIEPKLNIFQFFQGETKAWGIVQDSSGNLVQRFTVDLIGTATIQENTHMLTLDETFHYGFGDGVKKRVWTLTRNAQNQITGSAPDIATTAQGAEFGNAFQFTYEMDLPVGDTSYRVTFDDWMWAFDDKTLINRSYIKKFGFVVAEVTIFMQKP